MALEDIVRDPRSAKAIQSVPTVATLLQQNAAVQSVLAARFAELIAAPRDTVLTGNAMGLKELSRYSGRSVSWLRQQIRRLDDPLPHQQPRGRGGKITVKPYDYDAWSARQNRGDINVKKLVAEVTTRMRRG